MVVAKLQKVDNDQATMHISLLKMFMPEQRFKVLQFLELGEIGCGLVGCGLCGLPFPVSPPSYPSQLPLPCYEFCPIHAASINDVYSVLTTPKMDADAVRLLLLLGSLAEKSAIVAAFARDQFHLEENV